MFAAHRNEHLTALLRSYSYDLKAKEPQSERKRKKASKKDDKDKASTSVVHIIDEWINCSRGTLVAYSENCNLSTKSVLFLREQWEVKRVEVSWLSTILGVHWTCNISHANDSWNLSPTTILGWAGLLKNPGSKHGIWTSRILILIFFLIYILTMIHQISKFRLLIFFFWDNFKSNLNEYGLASIWYLNMSCAHSVSCLNIKMTERGVREQPLSIYDL